MSATEAAPACYREATNGVYFTRAAHRIDCTDPTCRGCRPCSEPRHCTAGRNCSWHIAEGELTCGRCIAAARRDLRWMVTLASLLLDMAVNDGLRSEAANLAGPAADAEAWSWRKVALLRSGADVDTLEDDDEHHPRRVAGTWARMLTEDYGHDMPEQASLSWCVAYLDRTLARVAHDDEQDFPLLARELRKCRQHLEAALHNDDRGDRGVRCPECEADRRTEAEAAEREGRPVEKKPAPRLRREYAHWCDDPTCEKLHYADDSADEWICTRDSDHAWSHEDYTNRLEERRKARSA